MVGRWEGTDGKRRGRFIFYDDLSYRSESIEEWEQGSWRFNIDEQAVELVPAASSDVERVGVAFLFAVADSKKDERLVLRDRESGTELELRPIEPLSESERRVVGEWRTRDSDKEERFEFFADRRFVVTTPKNRDAGYWRIFGGGAQFEMVIESTSLRIHRGVALRGTVLKLDDSRLEFENTVGGGIKSLERVTPRAEDPEPGGYAPLPKPQIQQDTQPAAAETRDASNRP